jgi:flagellar biosynthesis/type III secretory pathway chaperone
MNRASADECRNGLYHHLNEGIAALSQLDELLLSERQAVTRRDSDALVEVAGRKDDCLQTLEKQENGRLKCCAGSGFATSAAAMDACLDWCDPQGALAGLWSQYRQLAAKCSTANLTNGAIIRARQQQINTALAVLCGGEPAQTYGPSGNEGLSGSRALAEA